MKKLLMTRRAKIYSGIVMSAIFAITIAFSINSKPNLFKYSSAADDFSITFNHDNGGTGFPSSYGNGVNNNGHTKKGNPIEFTYNNAKSTSNKYCTLASGGYLYNSTVLTGLESVNVTFSGGSLSLYSSKSATFSGDAKSLTSGTALNIGANYDYFKLLASGETVVESITVYYTCAARPESSEETDVITATDLNATTTQYVDFSGVTKSSGAVYAGNNAKDGSGNIQPVILNLEYILILVLFQQRAVEQLLQLRSMSILVRTQLMSMVQILLIVLQPICIVVQVQKLEPLLQQEPSLSLAITQTLLMLEFVLTVEQSIFQVLKSLGLHQAEAVVETLQFLQHQNLEQLI